MGLLLGVGVRVGVAAHLQLEPAELVAQLHLEAMARLLGLE